MNRPTCIVNEMSVRMMKRLNDGNACERGSQAWEIKSGQKNDIVLCSSVDWRPLSGESNAIIHIRDKVITTEAPQQLRTRLLLVFPSITHDA